MSISVSYYLIFDIAKVINKVERCIFWTTFLLLNNIKSLIISGKRKCFGKLLQNSVFQNI